MKDLGGRPLLQFLIERLKRCKKINDIYIATTSNQEDNSIEDLARRLNCKTVRGSENDVLSRFFSVIIWRRFQNFVIFSDPLHSLCEILAQSG